MKQQASPGLSLQSLGHLNYLHNVLAQPLGSWEGFYTPQSPSMNFALRYQLAFGAYAVAAMAQLTPAYRAPYQEALKGAIDKMLDVASWGYWHVASPSAGGESPSLANSGHVALLLSPHATRQTSGPPSDPIARDNLQYSGHLGTMLGLYEKVSGDCSYDSPFSLNDPDSGVSFSYTYEQVAARIHDQMKGSRFGGVCCETGIAYVPCNNHALASNALHDALRGTSFSGANSRWLRSVRSKMVLHGPTVRGIFSVCYVKDLGAGAPVAFNFTDAWGLAFMLPFDRQLVRRLYPKFRRRLTRAGREGSYLSSSPLSEKVEISDEPINTGFALIAARGLEDSNLARSIERYAASAFEATWEGPRLFYRGAPRTLHATALYALAAAIEPGGDNFVRLFNQAPDPATTEQPYLAHVSDATGRVGVSQAQYHAQSRTLEVALRQVADPTTLQSARPLETTLTLANVKSHPHITVGGVPLPEENYPTHADGTVRVALTVDPQGETSFASRFD